MKNLSGFHICNKNPLLHSHEKVTKYLKTNSFQIIKSDQSDLKNPSDSRIPSSSSRRDRFQNNAKR